MNKPFKFKQFTVHQDRCAMKIGTDGVLLGAWASVNHRPNGILDIGAGTGVIALMMAQRSDTSTIDALEIDPDAYEQCSENFEQSPWADRLFCYHASLLEFAEEIDDTYDSIICNPPFYAEDYKTESEARDTARFQDAMPFEHLVYAVSKLLSDDGVFSLILPYNEEQRFIDLVFQIGLKPSRICRVKGNSNSGIVRSLIEFSYRDSDLQTSELIIEKERHNYTEEYVNLTKAFYIKM